MGGVWSGFWGLSGVFRSGGRKKMPGDKSETKQCGSIDLWLVLVDAGTGPDDELQLDLKGVVYSVSVLPAATSLCVVNITQTEARVETLVGSFLQLQECSGPGGDGAASLEEDHFLFDDDDNYQVWGGPWKHILAPKSARF
jgi:hypothetical protein